MMYTSLSLTSSTLLSWSFISLYTITEVSSSPPCKWNQITIQSKNSTLCWDCPKCPYGFGLSPQCGSYVDSSVKIECLPCAAGVSYSDAHDISSCRPCSICGEHEVTIKRCTVERNAECGECKQGYYRSIAHDCWPCMKCCPNSTKDEIEPGCLDQGLPADQSCRLDTRTTDCPDALSPASINHVISTIQSDNTTKLPSDSPKLARVTTGSRISQELVLGLLIAVILLIALVVVGVVGFFAHTGCHCSYTSTMIERPPVDVMDEGGTPSEPQSIVFGKKCYSQCACSPV